MYYIFLAIVYTFCFETTIDPDQKASDVINGKQDVNIAGHSLSRIIVLLSLDLHE